MTNKNDVFDRAINNFKYVSSKRAYHYEQKFRYLPFWLSESSYIFKKEANNQLNKPYPYFKRGAVIRVNFGVNEGSEFSNIHFAVVLDKRDSPRKRTLTVVPLTSKNGTNRFSLGKEIFNQTLSFLNKQFDSMKLMQKELITKRENLNNALLDLREQTWLDDNGIIQVKDNKEFKVQNDKTDKQHDSFMAIQNKFTKEFFKLQKVTDMYQTYNKNSFVRLTDITTISKLRIHKINNYDPSGNICLTSQQMKAISDELMKLYISK